MSEPLKHLKKGSVNKFKELMNKVRKTPLTPEDRQNILDVFKKKDSENKTEKIKRQKIAKPDQDLGV